MSNESETPLSQAERDFIKDAYLFLERPSFLIRIANAIGKPIEGAIHLIPEDRRKILNDAVQKALKKGLQVVRSSVASGSDVAHEFEAADTVSRKSGAIHSLAAFGTGATSGFFGLALLPIELPFTTAIILRTILKTAEQFGMDVDDPRIQLECLYILSLGSSKTSSDDAMESAYWTSRVAFSRLIQDAARDLKQRSTPTILRFLGQVAARYNIVVSQKAMAVLVPAVGSIGGGLINAAFTDYFSDAARYHFGLKALERRYGTEEVRRAYDLHRSV